MAQKIIEMEAPSSEELWAAYDRLAELEKQERSVWLRLNEQHLAACEAAAKVFHLASQAWDAYQSVYEHRSDLYESAREAERNEKPPGSRLRLAA